MGDEEATDTNKNEHQKKANKLNTKNTNGDSLAHELFQAWGDFSYGYRGLADLSANSGLGKGKYDDAAAEKEYYAQLAQNKYGKTKIDNRLTMSFVCAPSFDEFATIMFPAWPRVKASGVYSDVSPIRKNGQKTDQDKKSDNKNQSSNVSKHGQTQNKADTKNSQSGLADIDLKNVKVDPKYSKDSLFPTKAKEDDKSLF